MPRRDHAVHNRRTRGLPQAIRREYCIRIVALSALAEFVRNAVAQWHFSRGSVYLWTMALASVLHLNLHLPHVHVHWGCTEGLGTVDSRIPR
jgi:hypothetical protein